MIDPTGPLLDAEATARHADDAAQLLAAGDVAAVARRLGGHGIGSAGAFGFWVPMEADAVSLEILLPPPVLDPGSTEPSEVEFSRSLLPMTITGDYAWAVVEGLAPGRRRRLGPLYRAVVHGSGGDRPLIDPMAISTPFGAFAPSELLDTEDLASGRGDAAYFAGLAGEGVPRLGPFSNLLQIHVQTATRSGTLAALVRTLDAVAARIEAGEPLTPADELWLGYDAYQLMPVEPTIRREGGPHSFEELAADGDVLRARVRRPASTNWGYDVVIAGSGAVNPALLETGRPHELSDLAVRLHTFPGGPIALVLDVVFGHADNQAVDIMPAAWFTGPDMYGQHLDYLDPAVRAQLLEMQRRKADHGADGIRIDGAQDFTWWDPEHRRLVHDDEYLLEMSEIVQEIAGVRYRPWMIFEDGRPWPREDWEIASSYRAVIERQPHTHQWGPLTFAHNTPFLFTFWLTRWWRLREIAEFGGHWVSGCANHDTLRRGSQVDPGARINTYLGDGLPEIIERSYDHPASTLLFHCFLPGVPMDFLQAIARVPWGFIRNTDRAYAIKVWAEEARFLDWRVPPHVFDDPANFRRLKALGFTDLGLLREFMGYLAASEAMHGDAIEPVLEAAGIAPRPDGFDPTFDHLLAGYRAWMDDVRDLCCVDAHLDQLDPSHTGFDLAARRFRLERPWLGDDLGPGDRFEYLHPSHGAAVFRGVRTGPGGSRVLFVANMEGAPREIVAADTAGGDWQVALASPGIGAVDPGRPAVLSDGEGFVCVEGD